MSKTLLIIAALAVMASPACASWSDGFAYPNGPLAGNDGWTGPAGTGIDVVTGAVKIQYGTGGAMNDSVNIADVTSNWITCTAYAWAGASTGSNIWGTSFNDDSGRNFARWYGSGNSARPRINGYGAGYILDPVTLVADEWNELKVIVDLANTDVYYYHNGNYLGVLDYAISGATGGVGTVVLENLGRSDCPDDYIYIDNMSVVPEPSSLLALSVFGVGMLGYIRRRR